MSDGVEEQDWFDTTIQLTVRAEVLDYEGISRGVVEMTELFEFVPGTPLHGQQWETLAELNTEVSEALENRVIRIAGWMG